MAGFFGNIFGFILSICIGGVSGWIAGRIMKSEHGFLVNILLGVVGGAVASALFGLIGIGFHNIIGYIVCGVVGACLLIVIVRQFKK